jgi:hypothetical protein
LCITCNEAQIKPEEAFWIFIGKEGGDIVKKEERVVLLVGGGFWAGEHLRGTEEKWEWILDNVLLSVTVRLGIGAFEAAGSGSELISL